MGCEVVGSGVVSSWGEHEEGRERELGLVCKIKKIVLKIKEKSK